VRTKTTGADGNFNQGRISDQKLDNTIDAIKIATDTKARDALIKEALEKTRDEAYYIPLHYQMRPWAMKKNVSTVYNVIDVHESRYVVVK
jgi:peptide/nickel transport system substrate-binding protein